MMIRTRLFYGWIIVSAAIVVGFLTTGLSGYANGILLPELAATLSNGNRGPIALGFSLATIFGTLVAPFIGRLADEYSPRKLMMVGSVLLTVSYVGLASATKLWHMYLFSGLVFALGMAMAGPMVRSLLVARWFERYRGRALGVSVLGASIAGVVLPVILSDMIDEYGWRNTIYFFSAIIVCILLPLIFYVMRDTPEDIGEVRDGHRASQVAAERGEKPVVRTIDTIQFTWRQMLQNKSFWAIGLTFGPMVCVYLVTVIHLFGHILESGLERNQAAFVLSVFAFSAIVGKPIMGFMADLVGLRTTLWTSLALQCSALILFTVAGNLPAFLASAIIHGLGYSALSSMRTYSLAQTLGIRSLGSSTGLLRYIELPFASIASPVAGFVFDATGSYDIAFLILAGFLVIAAIGPFFLDTESGADETEADDPVKTAATS